MIRKILLGIIVISAGGCAPKKIVIVPAVGNAASSQGSYSIFVECQNKACEEARFLLKKVSAQENLEKALLEREQKLRALEEQLKNPSPPAKPKAK